jgi:hypothetical protein
MSHLLPPHSRLFINSTIALTSIEVLIEVKISHLTQYQTIVAKENIKIIQCQIKMKNLFFFFIPFHYS